ncbi:MAG: hypothetical protein ACRCX2_32000 [Paraclostridium sp.]
MELYVKLFIFIVFIGLVESLLNINRKKLPYYESKKFEVLDDKYYKLVFISDVILFLTILIISLLSSKIDSIALYSAICTITVILMMQFCKYIGLRKMYIKKLK